jgi:hypothetical protein
MCKDCSGDEPERQNMAEFRALIRSKGKIDREAYLADIKADIETDRIMREEAKERKNTVPEADD